ncbi:MAG: GNAT family N-acetyltransferase [Cellulosilyticaceae bacterium]
MLIRSEIILVRIQNNRYTRKRIAKIFAECFEKDMLYEDMIPDERVRRSVLEIFFQAYLEVWAQYGELMATSLQLEGVAYIYDEELFEANWKHWIEDKIYHLRTLGMLRYISFSQWRAFHKTLGVMSSEWIGNHIQGEYMHLDLLGVRQDFRKHGYGKKLIEYAKQSAKMRQIPLTLETQNHANEVLYQGLGFGTCEQISLRDLTQYCMIYREEIC